MINGSSRRTTNDQDRLLADETKVIESIDEALHGFHVLVELSTLHGVNGDGNVVVLKVSADLVAIELLQPDQHAISDRKRSSNLGDRTVHDDQNSLPLGVELAEDGLLFGKGVSGEAETCRSTSICIMQCIIIETNHSLGLQRP